MTTMNSNERAERLKQIRERLAAHRTEAAKYHNREWAKGDALHYYEAPDDVETLLSLLDSQAQLSRELALIVDVGTSDDPGTAITKLRKLERDDATRMRDKCVRKVRELEAAWLGDSRTEANDDRSNAAYEKCCAARVIAKDLESLTLDQVEQKEAK